MKRDILKITSSNHKLNLELNEVKCETYISGAKNTNFLFRRADLKFFEEYFLVIGYVQFRKYKFYKTAIIFTNKKIINSNLKAAIFIKPKKINLNSFNKDVYIEFGKSKITDTNVEIRIKNLTEEQKKMINI